MQDKNISTEEWITFMQVDAKLSPSFFLFFTRDATGHDAEELFVNIALIGNVL